jgi:uncharacterized protein YycO
MKTTIGIADLRMADIIVSTTDAGVSRLIRLGIGSDFSHTMLYKGSSCVIEAVESGIMDRQWSEASKNATLAIALRRRNMTEELKKAVIGYALAFKDKKLPYDKIGAMGAGMVKNRGIGITSALMIGGCSISAVACTSAMSQAAGAIRRNASDENKDKAFFCSELVARAYEMAGVPLSDGVSPSYMNPREVRMSSKLIYVGHLLG